MKGLIDRGKATLAPLFCLSLSFIFASPPPPLFPSFPNTASIVIVIVLVKHQSLRSYFLHNYQPARIPYSKTQQHFLGSCTTQPNPTPARIASFPKRLPVILQPTKKAHFNPLIGRLDRFTSPTFTLLLSLFPCKPLSNRSSRSSTKRRLGGLS